MSDGYDGYKAARGVIRSVEPAERTIRRMRDGDAEFVAVEGVLWCPVHNGVISPAFWPDVAAFCANRPDGIPGSSPDPCDLLPLFYRQEPVTEEET